MQPQQDVIRIPQIQYRFSQAMGLERIRRIINLDNSLLISDNPALRRFSVLPEPETVMVELPIPRRPVPSVRTPTARKGRNARKTSKT